MMKILEFLRMSDIVSGSCTVEQVLAKRKQTGREDCGVYCAIFARNVMCNEDFKYEDTNVNERITIRKLIVQSIYMNQDLRITDELQIAIRAEERLDLECRLCKKTAPNKDAKRRHDEAMHPQDGRFLCHYCNTKVAHMNLHLSVCRPKLDITKRNRFAQKFSKSAFKMNNAISLKSPILKPSSVYGHLSVGQVEERNRHQMDKEIWQTKAAIIHDSDRRKSSNY